MKMRTKNGYLNKLADEIHRNAVSKGFYDVHLQLPKFVSKTVETGVKNALFAQTIALIHSELSEALEAYRKERFVQTPELEWAFSTADESQLWDEHFPEKIKDTVEDELADVIIRVLDLCGHLGIDIQAHVDLKMRYNKRREYKHGKQF